MYLHWSSLLALLGVVLWVRWVFIRRGLGRVLKSISICLLALYAEASKYGKRNICFLLLIASALVVDLPDNFLYPSCTYKQRSSNKEVNNQESCQKIPPQSHPMKNTMKPLLSRPPIKRTPSIKRTLSRSRNQRLIFHLYEPLFNGHLYKADANTKII